MPSLLYVCTGNICRSPFAERMSRHLLQESGAADWQINSLGTSALRGHPMDKFMAHELEARGGSSAGFEARQATFDRLEAADLVIGLSASHRDWVLQESPSLLSRTFTLGQLARFVEGDGRGVYGADFLAALRRHRSRARRRDDIPDPYRKGADAAAAAATAMTGLLDRVLPHVY